MLATVIGSKQQAGLTDTYTHLHTYFRTVCVCEGGKREGERCVCVCIYRSVCVRGELRERERERGDIGALVTCKPCPCNFKHRKRMERSCRGQMMIHLYTTHICMEILVMWSQYFMLHILYLYGDTGYVISMLYATHICMEILVKWSQCFILHICMEILVMWS